MMAATSGSGEVRLLREEFYKHEERDENRFSEVREDLKEHGSSISVLNQKVANMSGRMTVLGALAILLIPVLTEVVHAFFGPHAGVK